MTAEKMKKHKLISAITAVSVSAAILLTGTFAWQSISQQALNETMNAVNPGARLHDDFDGRNKDVYVENFTDPDDGGVPVYARVRLDEYMEIGPGAGEQDGNTAESLVVGGELNDVTTWKTHIPGNTIEDGALDDPFHEYWSWRTGGSTIYMPTFNKNKDSLKADVNGTYEGNTPDDTIHYDDYVEYTLGQRLTGNAVYDNDDNDDDEGEGAIDPDNITTVEETHTAANTLTGTTITMQQWLDMGAPVGPFWVYDTDGWAYWAQPIQPGTATGLLLDGITLQKEPDEDWYYGINVVGQFATVGDWGSEAGNDGFFGDNAGEAPSDNAIFLLNQAAGLETVVTVTADADATTVQAGGTLQFTAAVTLGGADHINQEVSWEVSGNTSVDTTISESGELAVGADETAGGTLTVKATSKANGKAVGVYMVTVTEAGA